MPQKKTEAIAEYIAENDYLCTEISLKYVFVMSIEEKKERMARNYAINSKKTPRTRRMAFAVAHAGGITITDPKLAAKLKNYVPDYDPATP